MGEEGGEVVEARLLRPVGRGCLDFSQEHWRILSMGVIIFDFLLLKKNIPIAV